MEVIGLLKAKFDTVRVSDRFQKREFVLSTDTSTPYPQHVSFQVTQDKCALLDSYREGEELKVQFNLRGREWNGPQGVKYFNTLEAWRIERLQGGNTNQGSAQSSARQGAEAAPASPVFNADINDNDDLPF